MEQLDVRGEINVGAPAGPKQHYRIIDETVLSIDGTENVFVGVGAGTVNAGGLDNTFVGENAGRLSANSTANTFVGQMAGFQNSGIENVCVGQEACQNNPAGIRNTMVGEGAGLGSITGSNNTFVGWSAGTGTTNGDNNIYVGSGAGVGSESNTTRIGTSQTAVYIAGITPPPDPSVNAVCVVPSSGRLWYAAANSFCVSSSRRFKEQIADMGDSTSKLLQLRPVTFFYKAQYDDGSHLLQYGLIAEEVAKVYPEMAAYEKDGTPYTVRYQMLTPMLLNEFQKEHSVVMAQQKELQSELQQIKAQRQEIDGLKLQLQQQNASLQERLTKLESYVATQMKTASDNPSRTAPGANGGLQ